MKGKKRISLLAVLACAFALVFSLGLMSACGDADNKQAADGTWFYGTTVPADTLGAEGDYYLNTETLTAYAKTADGTWQKTTLYCGNEVPAGDVGEEGALFLELDEGVLHQKGSDGWKEVLTLKGKPGRDGVIWFSGPEDPTAVREDARLGDFYLNTTSFEV